MADSLRIRRKLEGGATQKAGDGEERRPTRGSMYGKRLSCLAAVVHSE